MPESVIAIIERGRALSAVGVLDAMALRDRLRQLFNEIVQPYDAILTPAAVDAAPPAEEGTGDPIFAATWTLIGGASGQPALARRRGGLASRAASRRRAPPRRRPSSRRSVAHAGSIPREGGGCDRRVAPSPAGVAHEGEAHEAGEQHRPCGKLRGGRDGGRGGGDGREEKPVLLAVAVAIPDYVA